MHYGQVMQGIFLARPNRFIAQVKLGDTVVTAHVKNTGRCRELLLPGVTVYLEHSENPARKTQWSLVAVQKGERLINMDSQAPNKVVGEWLKTPGAALPGLEEPILLLRPEYRYGDSRLDFYFESATQRGLIEVKGVTLEQDGVVLFPDAPTLRGIKHLEELARAVGQGYLAYAVFVVQMEGVDYMGPNTATQPAFGQAMEKAAAAGVTLLARDCHVTPESMTIGCPVPIRL